MANEYINFPWKIPGIDENAEELLLTSFGSAMAPPDQGMFDVSFKPNDTFVPQNSVSPGMGRIPTANERIELNNPGRDRALSEIDEALARLNQEQANRLGVMNKESSVSGDQALASAIVGILPMIMGRIAMGNKGGMIGGKVGSELAGSILTSGEKELEKEKLKAKSEYDLTKEEVRELRTQKRDLQKQGFGAQDNFTKQLLANDGRNTNREDQQAFRLELEKAKSTGGGSPSQTVDPEAMSGISQMFEGKFTPEELALIVKNPKLMDDINRTAYSLGRNNKPLPDRANKLVEAAITIDSKIQPVIDRIKAVVGSPAEKFTYSEILSRIPGTEARLLRDELEFLGLNYALTRSGKQTSDREGKVFQEFMSGSTAMALDELLPRIDRMKNEIKKDATASLSVLEKQGQYSEAAKKVGSQLNLGAQPSSSPKFSEEQIQRKMQELKARGK